MLESLSNKVAGLQACIFVKKRLQHRCVSVNTATFLRTSILKYIWERLLDCFCISETQTTNNVIDILAENSIFNFRIYEIFSYLLSFVNFNSIEFVLAFAFFSHTISNISHISNFLQHFTTFQKNPFYKIYHH